MIDRWLVLQRAITKNGKYMSEADAIKEGDHAAKN